MKRESNQKQSGYGSSLLRRVRVSGVVVGLILVLVSSCSSFNYEKGGTILGTVGGVGTGHYMCQSSGFGPKFGIGCMVLGGLMGGVMGGLMGESFDNKEIYDTVENNTVGDEINTYMRKDGSKMRVGIVDDYVIPQQRSYFGIESPRKGDIENIVCKDFEFEVQKGSEYKKGYGTSCLDRNGDWRTQGIDLFEQ